VENRLIAVSFHHCWRIVIRRVPTELGWSCPGLTNCNAACNDPFRTRYGESTPFPWIRNRSERRFVLRPVMGWLAGMVSKMSVVLQIRYAESEPELETSGRPIQFVLTVSTNPRSRGSLDQNG